MELFCIWTGLKKLNVKCQFAKLVSLKNACDLALKFSDYDTWNRDLEAR